MKVYTSGEFTKKSNEVKKGIESLKASVIRDCNEYCGCFNENGCDKEYGKFNGKICFHQYCDKYKWVIDRAKHYAEKLNTDWEKVLEVWESNRDYWYLNYYQDCNQPLIQGDNVKVFENIEEFKKVVGDKGFRCPYCKGVSTNPCECNSGVLVKLYDKKGKYPCNWKSYGLFGTMGKGITVIMKDTLQMAEIFMPIVFESE